MIAALVPILLMPSLAVSGEYLTGDEWKAQFCGKTYEGKNHRSGWTFKNYTETSCDKIKVHYLTGDKQGTTLERRISVYPSGDQCVFRDGKERCGKVKAMPDGEYHRFSLRKGRHTHTYKNFVDGNQL